MTPPLAEIRARHQQAEWMIAQGLPVGIGLRAQRDRAALLALVDALASLLREQIDAETLWVTDASAAFEREAEAFYRETRMLAPGKDDRQGVYGEIERREAWNAWNAAKRADRHYRWRAALALVEGPERGASDAASSGGETPQRGDSS